MTPIRPDPTIGKVPQIWLANLFNLLNLWGESIVG